MTSYYDESIFANGFSVRNYELFWVTNDADRFLVGRLGKRIVDEGDVCSRTDVVNLNPRVPCVGINLYTMNSYNKAVIRQLPYNSVTVSRDARERKVVPVYVGEVAADGLADSILYDISPRLDDFTAAVMIKYFSIHSAINITPRLYSIISRHFEEPIKRFEFDESGQPGLVQLTNGELIYNGDSVYEEGIGANISGPPVAL